MNAPLDAAWEAYRPQAAEHDTTPCRLAFEAGWTAQRDRIRQLAIDQREQYSDHARQAHALPRTADTLMLRADALGEFIHLLEDKS